MITQNKAMNNRNQIVIVIGFWYINNFWKLRWSRSTLSSAYGRIIWSNVLRESMIKRIFCQFDISRISYNPSLLSMPLLPKQHPSSYHDLQDDGEEKNDSYHLCHCLLYRPYRPYHCSKDSKSESMKKYKRVLHWALSVTSLVQIVCSNCMFCDR